MGQILFYLKRILMLPVALITSPGEVISSFLDDTGRGRALMLGLPAVLVAVIGMSSLAWAKYGLAPRLEERYKTAAEKSTKEKTKVLQKLQTELRMLHQAKAGGGGSDQLPDEAERRKELEDLQSRERVYLEKLISLNPEELDYRYQLALVSMQQGDLERGLALMKRSAPETEPGYAKAHLWLARFYMGSRPKSESEAKTNRGLALKHADHCLTRSQDNSHAKLIKARLLYQAQRFERSYLLFEELFEEKAIFYEPLTQINKTLGRENKNADIYNRALTEFQNALQDPEISVENWVGSWSHVVKCLVEKKEFEETERLLEREIQKQSTADDGAAKKVHIERLLSSVYLDWIRTLQNEYQDSADFPPIELTLLKKAFGYNPNHPSVLQGLARIAIGSGPNAAEALSIYDPRQHADAPASVLNELGTDALGKSQYEDAIRYFELGRKKAPNNPTVLNNLAYTYLVCERRNPERALKLVDEALRFLPNAEAAREVRSNFFDTRGTALMQLNRWEEAQADFEKALQDRQDEKKIYISLIRCCQANNLSTEAEIYSEKLAELERLEATNQ